MPMSVDRIVVPYPRKIVKEILEHPAAQVLPHPGYAGSFEYKTKVLDYDPISGFTITSDDEAKWLLDIDDTELEELRRIRDTSPRVLFQAYLLTHYVDQATTHPSFLERMENWMG